MGNLKDKKLLQTELSYKFLTENSSDILSRNTVEGIFIYVSSACINLLGYEPDDLIGRSLFEFIFPKDLDTIQRVILKIDEISDLNTISFRFRKKNGTYLWLETMLRSLRDKKTGHVEELIAVSRDISERIISHETLEQQRPAARRCGPGNELPANFQ